MLLSEKSTRMSTKITCCNTTHSCTFLNNHWEIYRSEHIFTIAWGYLRTLYEWHLAAHHGESRSVMSILKWSVHVNVVWRCGVWVRWGGCVGREGRGFMGECGEKGGNRGEMGEDLRMCVFRSVVYMLWLKTETYWGGFVTLSRITTTLWNGSPRFSR